MLDYVITSSTYIEDFFSRSFVWRDQSLCFLVKESQKFINRNNSPLVARPNWQCIFPLSRPGFYQSGIWLHCTLGVLCVLSRRLFSERGSHRQTVLATRPPPCALQLLLHDGLVDYFDYFELENERASCFYSIQDLRLLHPIVIR